MADKGGVHSFTTLREKLATLSPCFPVNPHNVQIVTEPSDFFNQLTDKIKVAKQRVTISSLYLGHDDKSLALAQTISESLRNNQNLKVTVLLDCLRGSRRVYNKEKEEFSSVSILKNIVDEFPDRVEAYFYHTPELAGVWKSLIPQRFNELIGVQHIKCYLVDDDVMISGANLSEQYFYNRQDRYMWINNTQHLSNFYDELVSCIGTFSFRIKPKQPSVDSALVLTDPTCPDPSARPDSFKQVSKQRLDNFWDSMKKKHDRSNLESGDAWIFPTLQTAPSSVTTEQVMTELVLQSVPSDQNLWLTSPYFNFTPRYEQIVRSTAAKNVNIIVASPQTNGFFKGDGVTGLVPWAYNSVLEKFFTSLTPAENKQICLSEYVREKWTFHAKGFWFDFGPKEALTVIGSSNFGMRSVNRDLESSIVLMSQHPELTAKLRAERSHIWADSEQVTAALFDTRRSQSPRLVHLTIPFAKDYM